MKPCLVDPRYGGSRLRGKAFVCYLLSETGVGVHRLEPHVSLVTDGGKKTIQSKLHSVATELTTEKMKMVHGRLSLNLNAKLRRACAYKPKREIQLEWLKSCMGRFEAAKRLERDHGVFHKEVLAYLKACQQAVLKKQKPPSIARYIKLFNNDTACETEKTDSQLLSTSIGGDASGWPSDFSPFQRSVAGLKPSTRRVIYELLKYRESEAVVATLLELYSNYRSDFLEILDAFYQAATPSSSRGSSPKASSPSLTTPLRDVSTSPKTTPRQTSPNPLDLSSLMETCGGSQQSLSGDELFKVHYSSLGRSSSRCPPKQMSRSPPKDLSPPRLRSQPKDLSPPRLRSQPKELSPLSPPSPRLRSQPKELSPPHVRSQRKELSLPRLRSQPKELSPPSASPPPPPRLGSQRKELSPPRLRSPLGEEKAPKVSLSAMLGGSTSGVIRPPRVQSRGSNTDHLVEAVESGWSECLSVGEEVSGMTAVTSMLTSSSLGPELAPKVPKESGWDYVAPHSAKKLCAEPLDLIEAKKAEIVYRRFLGRRKKYLGTIFMLRKLRHLIMNRQQLSNE